LANITSNGGNLIGRAETAATGCNNAEEFVQPNDQFGTPVNPLSPGLAALADNGGPTLTHLPQADSPAIDNGFNTSLLETDQRGFNRLVNSNIDVGSVETQLGGPEVFSMMVLKSCPPHCKSLLHFSRRNIFMIFRHHLVLPADLVHCYKNLV